MSTSFAHVHVSRTYDPASRQPPEAYVFGQRTPLFAEDVDAMTPEEAERHLTTMSGSDEWTAVRLVRPQPGVARFFFRPRGGESGREFWMEFTVIPPPYPGRRSGGGPDE